MSSNIYLYMFFDNMKFSRACTTRITGELEVRECGINGFELCEFHRWIRPDERWEWHKHMSFDRLGSRDTWFTETLFDRTATRPRSTARIILDSRGKTREKYRHGKFLDTCQGFFSSIDRPDAILLKSQNYVSRINSFSDHFFVYLMKLVFWSSFFFSFIFFRLFCFFIEEALSW